MEENLAINHKGELGNEVYPDSTNSMIRKAEIFSWDGWHQNVIDNYNYDEKIKGIPTEWNLENIPEYILEMAIEPEEWENISGIDIGIIGNGSGIVNMYRYDYENGKFILTNNRPLKLSENKKTMKQENKNPNPKKQWSANDRGMISEKINNEAVEPVNSEQRVEKIEKRLETLFSELVHVEPKGEEADELNAQIDVLINDLTKLKPLDEEVVYEIVDEITSAGPSGAGAGDYQSPLAFKKGGNMKLKENYEEEEEKIYEPEEDDCFISDARDGYEVSCVGKYIDSFKDFDDAVKAVNEWKDEHKYWPNTWHINERGSMDLIDDKGNMIKEWEQFLSGLTEEAKPTKGTPEWHRLEVAKKTMKMSDEMAGVMGGMTKEEAKEILKKYNMLSEVKKSKDKIETAKQALSDENRTANTVGTMTKDDAEEVLGKKAPKETVLKEMWKDKLQNVYADKDEFLSYNEIYGLARRLGYDSAETAWDANPLIQGSTNPAEYKVVKEGENIETETSKEEIEQKSSDLKSRGWRAIVNPLKKSIVIGKIYNKKSDMPVETEFHEDETHKFVGDEATENIKKMQDLKSKYGISLEDAALYLSPIFEPEIQ